MGRNATQRMYQKNGFWYGDFRDFAAQGGKKEALKPLGSRTATKDKAEAEKIAADRLDELKRLRDNHVAAEDGIDRTRLGDFVDYHLQREAGTKNSTAWLRQVEMHLDAAIAYFGPDMRLRDIVVPLVEGYAGHLQRLPKWWRRENHENKYGFIGPGTQRKYLYSLSKLFRRAIASGIIPQWHNPVAGLMEKPSGDYREADWLEITDATLLLHAAKLYHPKRKDLASRCVFEVVATMLLTGARWSEVCGLRITDVDFEREVIIIRRHDTTLKTPGSYRAVRLWPQLAEILIEYLKGPNAPAGPLLFPSTKGPEHRIVDMRGPFKELAIRLRMDKTIGSTLTRHTYCAARLQTLDGGYPIAQYTVETELGHDSGAMVSEVYGHLGQIRHRSEVVEYRIEQHADHLEPLVRDLEARSQERNAFAPNLHNRVPLAVEIAVLEVIAENPAQGSRPAARLLAAQGIRVSPSGVGGIWKRHGFNTAELRAAAILNGKLRERVDGLRAAIE